MIGEGCGSIAGENLCGNVAPSLSQVRAAPHPHPSPSSTFFLTKAGVWPLSSLFRILRGLVRRVQVACSGAESGLLECAHDSKESVFCASEVRRGSGRERMRVALERSVRVYGVAW